MATIEEDGYENYINEKKGMAGAIYHPQYCEEGSWKVVVWDLEEGYDEDAAHVGLYEWIEEAEEFLIDKNGFHYWDPEEEEDDNSVANLTIKISISFLSSKK